MNKYITFIIYILLFVWSVCALQYRADAGNKIIGFLFTSQLLLLEITALVVFVMNLKNLSGSRLNVLIFSWMLYVSLNTFVCSEDLFLDFREVLWWPLIYFLFYFIAYNDTRDKYIKLLVKLFPILFMVLLFEYLYIRSINLFSYSESGKITFGSSNAIFFNALLLPFAFLLKNKLSKYLILIIGFILVLLSFKRSALIYTVVIIIIAIYYDFIGTKNTSLIKGLFISCLVIAVGIFAFEIIDIKTEGHISQRFELLEEDNGSGRSEIYENVWKLFKNRSFEYKVIGSGQNSVIQDNEIRFTSGGVGKKSAHNDFLEILYDFGIIGLLIYLSILFYIVKRLSKLKQIDERFFQANFAALIIFVVMSMVSHLILYPDYFAYLVIMWAITEGVVSRKKITGV